MIICGIGRLDRPKMLRFGCSPGSSRGDVSRQPQQLLLWPGGTLRQQPAPSFSLVEVTGGFASGRHAAFERWLQDPGSLCEGASAAAVSARLCAYGKTLGYQLEHVEWDARSAGQKLLSASKDTTVASERGSRHFLAKVGGGV